MFLSEYSGGGACLCHMCFWGSISVFCCLMADFPVLKDLFCQCRSQVVCFVYVCSILEFCHRSRCVGVLQGSCCFRFLCSAGSIGTFITQFMQWFLRMSLSWCCLVWLCLMCPDGCLLGRSCFCTRPFVLCLSLMIDRWLMACEMDGGRCGLNHRI